MIGTDIDNTHLGTDESTVFKVPNTHFIHISMKSYYLYIEAGQEVNDTSKFFKVAIGTSARDQRDLRTLMLWAEKNGHYFKVWSREVDDFVKNLARSLQVPILPLTWLSCRELCRYLNSQTLPPMVPAQLEASNHQAMLLNLDYRVSSNLNRRKASHC